MADEGPSSIEAVSVKQTADGRSRVRAPVCKAGTILHVPLQLPDEGNAILVLC
jgi:hypothetical protein